MAVNTSVNESKLCDVQMSKHDMAIITTVISVYRLKYSVSRFYFYRQYIFFSSALARFSQHYVLIITFTGTNVKVGFLVESYIINNRFFRF